MNLQNFSGKPMKPQPDYYDECAAKEKARHEAEVIRWNTYKAAQARLPPNSRDCIDPTAGDVRRSFYETLSLRGD